MKKGLTLALTCLLAFGLVACQNHTTTNDAETDVAPQTETVTNPDTNEDTHALVVYFSWSGNTEAVANEIQAQTNADVFQIVPAQPYTDDYNTLLDIAREEQANDERPEIAGTVENFEQYDMIYIGSPNWWGDMPMIMYTFYDTYDFAGKTIAPFVTSGGSGFSGILGTIEELEPEATITEGLSLSSSEAENSREAVSEWLAEIATVE